MRKSEADGDHLAPPKGLRPSNLQATNHINIKFATGSKTYPRLGKNEQKLTEIQQIVVEHYKTDLSLAGLRPARGASPLNINKQHTAQ